MLLLLSCEASISSHGLGGSFILHGFSGLFKKFFLLTLEYLVALSLLLPQLLFPLLTLFFATISA
jgi:hypothetical protein